MTLTHVPLAENLAPLDRIAMRQARARLNSLTKPIGSLGALEKLAIQVAGITGRVHQRLPNKTVVVLAGDHGVVAEGVSAYPQAVTAQMVTNFLRGGAAINVLARQAAARVRIVDVGVASELPTHPDLDSRKIGYGTANLACGPAMTRDHAEQAISVGAAIVDDESARNTDLIAIGEMGIGNTTAGAATTAATRP